MKRIAAAIAWVVCAARAGAEIKPEHVLVVVNDSSAVSQAIGAYYAGVRGIPAANVMHLGAGTTTAELVTRGEYNAQVRDPIRTYLTVTAPGLQAQIRCILVTKGVPLGVVNSSGSGVSQNAASVDSELTQLFTGLVPDAGQNGRIANPYFGNLQGIEQLATTSLSYLVCRLDGYADAIDAATGVPVDVKALIDRAQAPAASGTYLLDGDPTKTGGFAAGESWMNTADATLVGMGLAVVHDVTTSFVSNQAGILGYASWGSNDANSFGPPYYGSTAFAPLAVPGAFLPGSVATDYVSTSARSFAWPPTYGQSLVADLIRMGCTGANGHVFEPFLDAVSRPDRLFPKYARGFTAAESFYTSIAWLSWENVVVCDPLMRRLQVVSQVTNLVGGQGPQAGGTTITLVGKNFTEVADTQVTVGGVTAQVLAVQATTLTLKSPPNGPGPAEVVMTNSSGTFPAPQPFHYTPSLHAPQNPQINATWNFSVYGMEALDAWVLFEGAPSPPIPVPPLGSLLVDPALPIFQIAAGVFPNPFSFHHVSLAIPNAPAAVGTTHRMQAIVGGGGGAPLLLSNAIEVTIQ